MRKILLKNIYHSEKGFSLVEMLAVLGVISILGATAILNIKVLYNPIANASFEVNHYLKLVRSKAISQTRIIKISPISFTKLSAQTGDSCNTASTTINNLSLELPNNTSFQNISWSLCFNQRGLSQSNTTFSITDIDSKIKTIEVALGGGVRILE